MKSEDFVGGVFALEWEMCSSWCKTVEALLGKLGHLGAGVTYEIFIKSS